MRRFLYAPLRGARVWGRRAPRVAAALPALPEATLLTPLCGALAATRQYATWSGGGAVEATRQFEPRVRGRRVRECN
jgi:hypothetical protein